MMSRAVRSRLFGKPAALMFAGLVGLAAASFTGSAGSAASAGGPFQGLTGVWGGNGTVTYSSGTRERLHCRVQYTQANDDNLQQALRCASDSYKFEINAFFQHRSGSLTGHWEEHVLNISGTLTGSATAGHIKGNLHGPGFLASVNVDTTGTRQSVVISTPDQQIRQVSIQVSKSN